MGTWVWSTDEMPQELTEGQMDRQVENSMLAANVLMASICMSVFRDYTIFSILNCEQ